MSVGDEMAQIHELLADLRAATEQLVEDQREIEQEREVMAQESTEAEEDRASAARSGEHGDDWQRVQRRIDAGQTSLQDVLTGVDESPEARRIRDDAAERMTQLIMDVRAQDEEDQGARFAGLNETFAQLREATARLNDQETGR